jgi:hypothetical protein
MHRVIRTKFDDSICCRCGKRFEKNEVVRYAKPIGVWCPDRCIPEFPEPTGQLAEVVAKLLKLEGEGRLKPYTDGILERYRVFGTIAPAHMRTMIPLDQPIRKETHASDPS